MKIVPTKDRVLLKKIKEEEKKSSTGLILSDSIPSQDRYRVIAGDQEGLVVYVQKYKGEEIIDQNGETYLVIDVKDVVAVEMISEVKP